MPLSFRCPGCGIQHTVPGKMAGKQVRCKCGALMGIPADPRLAADSHSHSHSAPALTRPAVRQPTPSQPTPGKRAIAKPAAAPSSSEISADCPGCGTRRMVPAAFDGKKVRCPCGTSFQIFGPPSGSKPQTQLPQTPKAQTAVQQPTHTAAETPASLFDELTDDEMLGDVKLQPLETTAQSPGQNHLANTLPSPNLGKRNASTSRTTKEAERASLPESIGYGIFFVFCALPALELNGFGFGLPITLPIALVCATLGGVIGGALVCPQPIAAGIIGGLLAGPPGLVAVYLYTLPRDSVYSVELIIIQGLASLPGVGVGYLIRKLLTPTGGSRASTF